MNKEQNENLEVKTDNEIFKCPGCGSNMFYDPDHETLSCDYCGSQIAIDGQTNVNELDLFTASDDDNSWEAETKVVHCDNCGANTVVDINDIARVCPFCGSPSVGSSDERAGMKPTSVVPFKVSRDEALNKYTSWIKRKTYVPKTVKNELPNPIFNGIYLPTWTYDANTISSYKGRFGEHYVTTVGSGKNRRTVTRTRYYYVNGTISRTYDDILISGSTRLEQKRLDKISPFNTNVSKEYDKRYLAGFSAEHYTINVRSGWDTAKKRIEEDIRSSIIRKYRPDVVSYLHIKTHYENITYKYVLVPLWLCTYKYNNKEYGFMVNGENGKITGKYPISIPKVLLTIAIFIIIIVVALIIYGLISENNQMYQLLK
ncbi:MAG TPA: TFIIB-type zinc ribbon-containing protein [Acholeplasmataceae bacterium]|nr:TFIIB-type zinc ribbon-containing protein [Acholeplasmataceae bacterium]